MNGVTLDKWKVFYLDGNYTYLIYESYLPSTAVNIENIEKNDNVVFVAYNGDDTDNLPIEGRTILINAMATKSNWDSLLTGTINGHPVNETRTENVWAMGSPTLNLWINSWNTSYPSDTLYIAQTSEIMSDGLYGFYIGESPNPNTDHISILNKTGYGNTLYFPQYDLNAEGNYSNGYWLVSPSSYWDSCWGGLMMNVDGVGCVSYCDVYTSDGYSFRPVIRLPSSVVNQ